MKPGVKSGTCISNQHPLMSSMERVSLSPEEERLGEEKDFFQAMGGFRKQSKTFLENVLRAKDKPEVSG